MGTAYGALVLAVMAALPGCKRELAGAPCPCVEGWQCCATQDICIRAEETCNNVDTADTHTESQAPTLVTSAPGAYWHTHETVTEVTAGTPDVVVNEAAPGQTWAGFGGAFNELGWQYLSTLSQADRDAALELLFGDDGARFNMGRIPIGGNDYADGAYTLDETENDTDLADFSLGRDEQNLIPYLQAATALRPDIRFWAIPWTPPTWMKTGPFTANSSSPFYGGTMKSDPDTLGAYARYFVKFVQAYAAHGIQIETVAPQNEPSYQADHPSCQWEPKTYAQFIGQHLGPALEAARLDTRIMLGTMSASTDDRFIRAVLSDDAATSHVDLVGAQWGMLENMASVQASGLPLWQTEHMGGNCPFVSARCAWITPKGRVAAAPNDHFYAIESWNNLHDWIKAGVSSYSAWNMVLDVVGRGIGGWDQNALLVVDTLQQSLIITPTYYVFRHVSRYVEPGAVAVATTGGSALAFKNPSGTLVTVLFNAGAAKRAIVAAGGKLFSFDMPESGWATLVWH